MSEYDIELRGWTITVRGMVAADPARVQWNTGDGRVWGSFLVSGLPLPETMGVDLEPVTFTPPGGATWGGFGILVGHGTGPQRWRLIDAPGSDVRALLDMMTMSKGIRSLQPGLETLSPAQRKAIADWLERENDKTNPGDLFTGLAVAADLMREGRFS